MTLILRKFCCLFVALTFASGFCSCDQKLQLEDTPIEVPSGGEEGNEPDGGEDQDPDQETVVPENADIISSAVLTFAYYDIVGEIDVESRRVDFYMEIYGDDAPNLRYLPVTFSLKDGYVTQGTKYEYIRLILTPEDQPAKVTFSNGDTDIEYDVYLDLQVKEVPRTAFEFKRGVSLSYWFQESIPWYDDTTIDEVSNYGFDHVRIPFDTKCLFNTDGSVVRAHMDQLHHVVRKCIDAGLNVILDMHWLNAGNRFYEKDAAEELVNNWKKLIDEFSGYPVDRLAYEILNEPHGYGWISMQRDLLHMIRHHEPSRVLFISPQGYNADAAADFSVHGGDPNLVMTFHYYQPMLASHRKLWEYTGPSHYPGLLFSDEEWDNMTDAQREQAQGHRDVVYDYDFVYGKMKAAADMAEKNGLRLHCGEFGYSKTNIREERLQWFKDIVKAFNECGLAYTVWENWGGDFGPGDWKSEPDEEVIDILLQH